LNITGSLQTPYNVTWVFSLSTGTCLVSRVIGGPDDETAAKIVRELQEKNILTFLSGHSEDGNSVTTAVEKGRSPGLDSRIVPLGLTLNIPFMP